MTDSAPPTDQDLGSERAASSAAAAGSAASRSSRPPPLPVASAPREPLGQRFLPLWVALASAAGLLFALTALGLLPAREPSAPKPAAFDPGKAVDPIRLPDQTQTSERVHRLTLWTFPLCARPQEGARLLRVALEAEHDSFVVWCRGEYVLMEVDARDEPPRVKRLARFSVRGELPGGAAAVDLDHDGALDLVLGVSPPRGVVHRPFSGVFWLRGRAQGGFDLPRTLVEMPVTAMAALELDDQPGDELVVLTRGDAAAQRAGELWVFAGGVSPTRVAVVPTALAPSDLALGPTRDGHAELWITATQPGSLVRLRFGKARADWSKPERSELALRGLQGFVAAPRGERALYVRDAQGVSALDVAPTPKLEPWLEHVEVGPAAWLRTGRESRPTLVAATQAGFAWFHAGARRDRVLPTGTRMLDANIASGSSGQARALLLLDTPEQEGTLALAVLPSDVRDEAVELELRSGAVQVDSSEAKVALE